MNIKNILLIIYVSCCSSSLADEIYSGGDENDKAFDYINHLRLKAGMTAFSINMLLSKAALKHASYCYDNRAGGHYETTGTPGFTGYDHVERTNAVGYLSRSTGENVSFHKGEVDDKKSIDGLMGAIYHRFGFLSFDYDEIGIGKIRSDTYSSYVYNMGNAQKNEMCSSSTSKEVGKYYDGVCLDKEFSISADEFDTVTVKTQRDNTAVVVWPAPDSNDVPPAFFQESPDPLPDYGVSGYPISIQFNPSAFPEEIPVVARFELVDVLTGLPLEIIKRIDKDSDQHKKFTEYEHAIFPEKRLGWSAQYRVEVSYLHDGESKLISWVFNTRDLNVPIYEIRNQSVVIKEKSANTFAIYLPPIHRNDAELSYRTKYRGLSDLDVQIVDGNTLLVNGTGVGEAEILFHGVKIKIKIKIKI